MWYANLRNDTVPYRHWSFQTNKNFILKTGSETDCSLLQMLLKISNVAKICNISIIGSVKDSFYLDWAGGWGGGWVLSWHWMWSHAAGYWLHCYCHVSRVTRHIAARSRPAHCRLATEPQLTLALLRWRHRRGQPSAVRRDAGSRAPRTAYAGMQVLCSVEAYTYNRDFWGCFSEHHNQHFNISHFCARLRMTPIYLFQRGKRKKWSKFKTKFILK